MPGDGTLFESLSSLPEYRAGAPIRAAMGEGQCGDLQVSIRG
jgi:hypothetical protein